MPYERGYHAQALSIAQRQEANELIERAKKIKQNDLRFLDYYVDYTRRNPRDETGPRRPYHLAGFAVSLMEDGSRGPGYACSAVEFARKRGLRRGNADDIRDQTIFHGIESALKKQRAEEGPRMPRRSAPQALLFRSIRTGGWAETWEVDYRAFIALMIVTGGRAKNVLEIRAVKVMYDPDYPNGGLGVLVLWSKRKVRDAPREALFYPFRWSIDPPSNIIRYFQDLRRPRRWFPFPSSEDMAANVNSKLRSWGYDFTSSLARAWMSTVLQRHVEAKILSTATFAQLMDHDYDTAREKYRLDQVVTTSRF